MTTQTAEPKAKKLSLKLPHFKRPDLATRKANKGWFFVLPFVIGLLAIYLPIVIDSVWFSFTTITRTVDTATNTVSYSVDPVGFYYYKEALVGSTTFLETLWSGVKQLLLNVPAIVIFSLFIAVILNQKMLGRAAFRAIFFIPVILATGMMETIDAMDVLSDSLDNGNSTLDSSQMENFLGFFDATTLLSTMKVGAELVQYVIDLVNRVYDIINDSGVQMLIFLAGLQSISPSIYEACQIEGATAWETFWKISFPMISPLILVNLIYTVIDLFLGTNNEAIQYINDALGSFENYTKASALSWMYTIVILLFVGIVFLLVRKLIVYQD